REIPRNGKGGLFRGEQAEMSGSEILSTLLGSEVRGDLLVLFHRNPGLIDTVDGVARRIGRTTVAVLNEVRELLELGVLRQKRIGPFEGVSIDRAKKGELLEPVANHLKTVRKTGEKSMHHPRR